MRFSGEQCESGIVALSCDIVVHWALSVGLAASTWFS